ncbi:MAG: 3-dehydroquinate synthase [Micrococcales bacterium]|nr:MAG: 3-dehydroquinate synthase [Micrococcales bacterium]PIE26758.1 MAG: 3-dehydroquinate synthase [Micrococcales bacterium]
MNADTTDTPDRPGEAASVTVTGAHGYQIHVGTEILDRVSAALGDQTRQVLLVHGPHTRETVTAVARELDRAGLRVVDHALPDAEQAKSLPVLAEAWQTLGRHDFTRSDAVVCVGGGAVTDAGGFIAATWLRGVQVVHVPTTLLGMVDAAVGGKTGINTDEGKNLVGAFHPPAAVICDLDGLAGLPRRDLAAGMAEVVKAGFIADPQILRLVQDHPRQWADVSSPVLAALVRRAVQVKADVVSADLRESSLREILNYGHTFGHAIEQVEGYRWRHGDAVSVGLVYAAELGRLAGITPAELVGLHRDVLDGLGLPTSYPDDRWSRLRAAMGRDKKARGATVRFVVLAALAEPTRLTGPDEALLRQAAKRTADGS